LNVEGDSELGVLDLRRGSAHSPHSVLIKVVPPEAKYLRLLAERTGLEPATPGVTGRYSNQLNYRSSALSDVAPPGSFWVVGADGIEPPTFAV
jgi:hypothetical protein